jgi:hypothetical protein
MFFFSGIVKEDEKNQGATKKKRTFMSAFTSSVIPS